MSYWEWDGPLNIPSPPRKLICSLSIYPFLPPPLPFTLPPPNHLTFTVSYMLQFLSLCCSLCFPFPLFFLFFLPFLFCPPSRPSPPLFCTKPVIIYPLSLPLSPTIPVWIIPGCEPSWIIYHRSSLGSYQRAKSNWIEVIPFSFDKQRMHQVMQKEKEYGKSLKITI